MATSTGKVYANDFNKFGFTAEEIQEAESRMVVRNFFRTDFIYGGPKDTSNGKWEAKRVAVLSFENPQKKRVYLKDEQIEALANAQADKTLKQGSTYVVDGVNLTLVYKALLFQPTYVVGDVNKDGLSKTYLLNNCGVDAENKIIDLTSDVRKWANANITDGVFDREWSKDLADILNTRGLVFEERQYTRRRKDGGTFSVKVLVPIFADTYTTK